MRIWAQNVTKTNVRFEISAFLIGCRQISLRFESWYFLTQNSKFGDLDSKFSKTSVKFEISTFKIGCMRIFVKIRELKLFGPFAHLGSKCSTNNARFEISTLEIGYRQNIIERLDSWYFLAQNTQIWTFRLEVWKTKASRKLQISSILKFWVVSAGFGSFWLVSGRFGSFLVLVSTGF